MEGIINVMQGDLRDLRTKTSKGNSIRFKKNMLGGYKINDVEYYIKSISDQFERSEEAYKERIDEFTTFSQMLTAERDNAVTQLQNAMNEANGYKSDILSLKDENLRLSKKIVEYKTQLEEFISKENEIKQNTDEDISLSTENKLLKTELRDIYTLRDKIAGENAVLKKQLENSQAIASLTEKEKTTLQENLTTLNSTLRHIEMQKNLKLSEYTEKQGYSLDVATQGLKNMSTALEEMRCQMQELFLQLKEENI